MAITTYTELKTAVANWLYRDDLTARVPEFIALAESEIRRRARVELGFAALSDSHTTSTLLTEAPDVYLYGALKHAAPYLVDDARAPGFAALFDGAIDAYNQYKQRTAASVVPDTYAHLITVIDTWLGRSDLTARIPTFIALTEARIGRDLTVMEMETVETGTFDPPTTVSIALPTGMTELRLVVVEDYALQYVPPGMIQAYAGMNGIPDRYTILDGAIQVAPEPASAYTYNIHCLKMPAALSDSNTSNWLFAAAPDIYLYGALLEAAPYLVDDGRIPIWAAAYQRAIDALHENDRSKRYTTGKELRMVADGHPGATRTDIPGGLVVGATEPVWAP